MRPVRTMCTCLRVALLDGPDGGDDDVAHDGDDVNGCHLQFFIVISASAALSIAAILGERQSSRDAASFLTCKHRTEPTFFSCRLRTFNTIPRAHA